MLGLVFIFITLAAIIAAVFHTTVFIMVPVLLGIIGVFALLKWLLSKK